jgi:hypothetical protein
MNHKWFIPKKGNVGNMKNSSSLILRKLTPFSQQKRLKKVALTFLASRMTGD